jgi:hypothetical protein
MLAMSFAARDPIAVIGELKIPQRSSLRLSLSMLHHAMRLIIGHPRKPLAASWAPPIP